MLQKNRIIPALAAILLLLTINSQAQVQLDLPRVSQKASVTQRIGLLDVSISYSRPNVKGRVIWGDLVPYDKVWRTGADEATTISVSEDVTLNGNKLAAGKYSLFTIPGKDEWTIIINKTAKQWGAFNYDSTKDVFRFKVKPQASEFRESLEYAFENITTSSAEADIIWDKLKVTFNINFDIDAKVYSNIKRALEAPAADDWVVYAASANYAAERKIHTDEALQWIEKSIKIKPTFYNYYVKAYLLADKGNFKEAGTYLDKSRQYGKTDPDFKNYSPQVEKLAGEIKNKK